ncbi:MAG: hypothetical protein GWP91_01560 [Rhodobacterales bacterium]|nr:hypothetical protein [Rhodobacterales bacterium]
MLHRISGVLCLLLAPDLASAAELYVGPTRLYATIQDAIDAAMDDDVIWVEPGTYGEVLVIEARTNLTIKSLNGPGTVVVGTPGLEDPANQLINTVTIDSSSCTLAEMTISGNSERRSVEVSFSSSVTLDTVVLVDGVGSDGHGGGNLDVFFGSDASVINSSIIGGDAFFSNAQWPFGGNARVWTGSTLTLTDSTISGGFAEQGGGLHADSESTLEISGGEISDNHAVGLGGGLYAGPFGPENDDVIVEATVFFNNSAMIGGAFSCVRTSLCMVTGSWFEGNTAGSGGAGHTVETAALMERNSFCQNAATGPLASSGVGGALFLDGAEVQLNNNHFFENVAEGNGGAIRSQHGSVFSTNNNYIGNSSTQFGGAVSAGSPLGVSTQFVSVNDFVAYNLSMVEGGFATRDVAVLDTAYGFYWRNDPNAGSLPMADVTSLVDTTDALINGYVPGNCDPHLQRPRLDSPLLWMGDPSLMNDDESRSHIGAFGGPAAEPGLSDDGDSDGLVGLFDCDDNAALVGGTTKFFFDDDGDGVGGGDYIQACDQAGVSAATSMLGGDCDDSDADSFPGNEETYYNGVDNDCDGGSDFDQDGDGHDSAEFAVDGKDCNDLDEAISPDAEDLFDDNIDSNCDGIDSQTWMIGGGGCGACNQSGAVPGGRWAAVLGLIAILRRKNIRNR